MSEQFVRETIGANGTAIIAGLVALKERRSEIVFVDTDRGFHVCLRRDGTDVKLMQVWGRLNQPTSEVLETRRQWFREGVELAADDEKRITMILLKANFSPTRGDQDNYRLVFADEGAKIKFGPGQVKKVVNAVEELADLLSAKTFTRTQHSK